MKNLKILCLMLLLSGCATLGVSTFNQLYGKAQPVDRSVETLLPEQIDYWADVEPIINHRCVVCHACYDAPCQLKLTAVEGIERGASHESIYNLTRPFPAEPSRLFMDANTVAQWRDKGFFPVLNEREQTPLANANAGVMYQMLSLKQHNPLPAEAILSEDFTLGIGRKNSCPKAETFNAYAEANPLWGMPYGTPALKAEENQKLMAWLAQGAVHTPRQALPQSVQVQVSSWESFLNQTSLKAQLMSRYLYEHLFLANLYFDDGSKRTFFKMVRSLTPSGEPIQVIATRRPYDDPGEGPFYYRLMENVEQIVVKTHMPYVLNDERREKWQTWFLNAKYRVDKLPSYKPEEAGNPFLTYLQIPTDSRYRFLLDEAHFTIMNFIKGPVCRGQVAVNVIRDHFWVFFVDPDARPIENYDTFLAENYQDFKMPNTEGDVYLPLTAWRKYANKQLEHLKKRDEYLASIAPILVKRDMGLVWDGDGDNPNAALTIFRHFDSASVEKGLLGGQPKTAWVMGYGLLERIYYLLAAGYDVYGNVGHQFLSRVYMDFLRMEGETNFLYFLPPEARLKERKDWYQGAQERAQQYLNYPSLEETQQSIIEYGVENPKAELFRRLARHLSPLYSGSNRLSVSDATRSDLQVLAQWRGASVDLLSEFSVLEIKAEGGMEYYSLLKNNGHKNVSSMFKEKENLLPDDNTVSVLKGIAGSYPNTFFSVNERDLTKFIQQVTTLSTGSDYAKLMATFGVRRTSEDFWLFSDRLHETYRLDAPIWAGYLDYNRLENR
jgi:hypothetical protein